MSSIFLSKHSCSLLQIPVIAGPATAAPAMSKLLIPKADERFSLPTRSPRPRARKLNADPEETISGTRVLKLDWKNNFSMIKKVIFKS